MDHVRVHIKLNKNDQRKGIYAFAFIGMHLGIRFDFGIHNPRILYGEDSDVSNGAILFIPSDRSLIRGAPALHWSHIDEKLILSSDSGHINRLFHKDGDQTIFNFDIIGAIFYLISRSEEYYSESKDQHGRFPHKESILYKSGDIRTPVVDHYLQILKAIFKDVGIESEYQRLPTAILSHDVDQPIRSVMGSIKLLIVGENPLGSRLKGFRDSAMSSIKGGPNPFWNFELYANAESQHGYKSAYYFTNPFKRTKFDPKYDVAKENFRSIIQWLNNAEFEIGLHGSYNALAGKDCVHVEKHSFEEKVGVKVVGYRGHYLRLNVNDGFSRLNAAGFTYDSTMGYSSAIGYRCGTGLPFFTFDINQNRALPLIEIPFCVMDGPLFGNWEYGNVRGILENMILDTISVQGVFSILWHLNTAYGIDYPEWFRVYNNVLEMFSRHNMRVVTPEILARDYLLKAKEWGYYDALFGFND